ncbi:MAG: DMT family transporter [Alphaproteobacteria bacterium]|nr:DMT family transporter [Alphaproteobacteria bacterium]
MTLTTDNRKVAIALALLAVGMASTQDAIIKAVSGAYPAYETVMLRGVVSLPILGVWLARTRGLHTLATPHWRAVILRGLILASAYFAYILALASMPMATSVSIYFTMPFFVAAFSGWALKERVPVHRWIAIALGFIGVLVMVRPGGSAFQPAAFLALYSAFAYAIGQMMGRSISQRVDTLVIANWQNIVYFSVAALIGMVVWGLNLSTESSKTLSFLTRPPNWPSFNDAIALGIMGVFSTGAMMAYVNAYRLAPANFVAPFEYSAMVWAVLYGVLLFGDFPDRYTWIGAAIVVGAGLFMLWRDGVGKRQAIG